MLSDMTRDDARCEQHKAVNGRHYLSFVVDGPADAPDEFELQPSPLEYERLKEHSTGDGVGVYAYNRTAGAGGEGAPAAA